MQICTSGVTISTVLGAWMSAAVTTREPLTSIRIVTGRSENERRRIRLTLSTISVTSSLMPGTSWNSCCAPSILIEVTAAPGSDESSTRRSALPRVLPYPASSGSIS